MHHQAAFQRSGGVQYPLHEIPVEEGALKSRNEPGDEIQRPVITDREDSMFTVYVELVSCVHGTLTPGGDPASLIIFQYEIHSKQDNRVIKAVSTDFEFSQTGPGSPSVIAYGPYIQRKFNATKGTVTYQKGLEAAAGVELTPAMVEVRYSAEQEKSHEQQYFEKVDSGRHRDDYEKRHHKVWWLYSQNRDQNHGVVPAFRTGVLLKRGDMSPFFARFKIKLNGGFRYGAGQKLKTMFSHTEVDDVINFSPEAKPWPSETTVDTTLLGKLAQETMLDRKLTPIWGVDIGNESV